MFVFLFYVENLNVHHTWFRFSFNLIQPSKSAKSQRFSVHIVLSTHPVAVCIYGSHDINFVPGPVQIFVKYFFLEATNTSIFTVFGTPSILRLFPKLSIALFFRSFYKFLLTVNCQKILRQLKVAPFRLFLTLLILP